ncbi:MAG: HNH endonuclease signature motif containing protein [Polyangiaceae bacterium]
MDIHHTNPRCEGGDHDPDGLICLCGAHHRAAHLGQLVITGNATDGFAFHHADGTPYGTGLHPEQVEIAGKAFDALRRMGFTVARARALIAAVQERCGPLDLPSFLTEALRAS